ncbi:MAG: class I SAM-dependent methyltransferase [Solirubrobacterales bacterium]|nr:class I SAM-dependent methyltransferase [Solirubrobacterales bacterium]
MHPFWDLAIEPTLDAAEATEVLEIGAEAGKTTGRLLDRAQRTGGTVHSVDPAPQFDVARVALARGERFAFHRGRSLEGLADIGAVDAALIDGDHNWYTVHSELVALAESAAAAGEPLPLLFIHDVGWPYGRRDMYYDPASIPDEGRQDAARAGIMPGRSELGSPGINAGLWNATHEGGSRNGVRTAVEDFVAGYGVPCDVVIIEGLHGLAVVCSDERREAAPGLSGAIARLRSPELLTEWSARVERWRIDADIARRRAEAERDAAAARLQRLEGSLLDPPEPGRDQA